MSEHEREALQSTNDDLCVARDEAHRNFGAAAHYLRLAQGHLEIDDDAGVLWDWAHAREYLKCALRAFEPARAAMRQRVDRPKDAA